MAAHDLNKSGRLRWIRTLAAIGVAVVALGAFAVWPRLDSAVHRMIAKPKVAASSKPPSPAEIEFIRQGVILQEYCRQGVNFGRFSDQLVQVNAARRLAERDMRASSDIKWLMFEEAMEAWEAVLRVWRRQIDGTDFILAYDPLLNAVLKKLDEPEIKHGELVPRAYAWVAPPTVELPSLLGGSNETRIIPAKEERDSASTKKLVRLGLTVGSEKFQRAIEFDLQTTLKNIEATRTIGK